MSTNVGYHRRRVERDLCECQRVGVFGTAKWRDLRMRGWGMWVGGGGRNGPEPKLMSFIIVVWWFLGFCFHLFHTGPGDHGKTNSPKHQRKPKTPEGTTNTHKQDTLFWVLGNFCHPPFPPPPIPFSHLWTGGGWGVGDMGGVGGGRNGPEPRLISFIIVVWWFLCFSFISYRAGEP